MKKTHEPNDHDRYDMVECGATGQPKLDLSVQLRRCSNPSTNATQLSSANMFHATAAKNNGPLEVLA